MSASSQRMLEGRRIWVAAGYVVVVLIWGTTWFAVRSQVNGTAPHVAAALRLGAASLIFFGIARAMGASLVVPRRYYMPLLAQGLCFFGVNYICNYTASQYLTSGVLAVVFSVSVPFNILADRVINGTRPRPLVLAAAAIGVGGIAIVFAGELARAFAVEHAWLGAALAVLSAAVVAVGNVLAARLAATDLGVVRLNAFGLAIGTAVILLWGAASGTPWSLTVTAEWTASFVYLLVVGSVAAFWIYLKILPTVGVMAGSYIVVLSPAVAVAISAALEGLPLTLGTLAGVALLLTGHSLLVLARARTP